MIEKHEPLFPRLARSRWKGVFDNCLFAVLCPLAAYLFSNWKFLEEVLGIRLSRWQMIVLHPLTVFLSGLVLVSVSILIVKAGKERSFGGQLFQSLSWVFWAAYIAVMLFSYYTSPEAW